MGTEQAVIRRGARGCFSWLRWRWLPRRRSGGSVLVSEPRLWLVVAQ